MALTRTVGIDPSFRNNLIASPAWYWPWLLKQSGVKWLAQTTTLLLSEAGTFPWKIKFSHFALISSLVWRRCREIWVSVHPTTEQQCLAFGLYTVAVRLSHTSEVRKWRILLQVAGVIWEELSSLRVGVFKSPVLLRNSTGEIQMARLETHFLTQPVYKTLT